MSNNVIIYHEHCMDGWGAAWLLSKYIDAELIPGNYKNPLPVEEITGKNLYLVDFSYKSDDLTQIINVTNACLILDHHKSVFEEIEQTDFKVFKQVKHMPTKNLANGEFKAVLNMDKSGVGLVMDYVHDHSYSFLENIQDRDLWKFELGNTENVFAAVMSYPTTKEAWDNIATKPLQVLEAEGCAIQRFREKEIEIAVSRARETVIPTGDKVWNVSCAYSIASDVAGELAKRDPDGYAGYYVVWPDNVQFGLRSTKENGADVSEIAARFGGGGHKNAAGFTVDTKTFLKFESKGLDS